MRFEQLKAILWMRWRMLNNLIRRRGKVGNTMFVLLVIALLAIAICGLIFSFLVGVETLPDAKPVHILLAWTVLTVALVFFWTIGVVTELQRSDAITIQSLLHLPASMLGVHLYNYLSSFVSVSLLVVLPPMTGLASASVWVFGPRMLLLFPLIAGMIGLLTALTYQLRGWLGTMIHDKRRRKNVVIMLTLSFAVLAQVPNLINISVNSSDDDDDPVVQAVLESGEVPELISVVAKTADSELDTTATETDGAQPTARELRQQLKKDRRAKKMVFVEKWLSRATIAVPFGWLPYGARSLMEQRFVSGLLCILGLLAIAGLSLRRSYRTTLRFVTGMDSSKDGDEEASPVPKASTQEPAGPLFVSRELPFFGEATSSIALAGTRSLWRAPEFKMVLLTPVFLLMFGGAAYFSGGASEVSDGVRPFLSLGAICMGLFTIMQLLQNQFGLDREGFRAFVLSPVPREKILIGKNLAGAPFGLCISAVALVGLQLLFPEDALHFLATWLLLPAGYIITCLVANTISILMPMRMKEGSMKADNAKFKTVLIQVMTLLFLPILVSPLALPSSLELLLGFFHIADFLPVHLITSCLVLAGAVWAYRFFLPKQGCLLQKREQRILDTLTRSSF
ncbi:MAG: ABC-2 type transport system permease protein [Candidatus Paceibacteria bacterium]